MGDLRKEETMVVGGGGEGENGEKDEKFLDGMAVMDFDMLCATVALQTEGGFYSSKGNNWGKLNNDDDGDDIDGGEFSGGVQRMWEGDVFDCLEDRRIALQTACCPCYRFGKNMGRAGLGHCFIQGTVYFILVITTLFSYITFTITRRHLFLYLALAFTVSAGTYFGYCRRQIRKQFNIRESRTLEINNVQNGIWRGRGDTFCVGSQGSNAFLELHRPSLVQTKFPDHCSMQRASTAADHSWSIGVPHAEPLVPPTQL